MLANKFLPPDDFLIEDKDGEKKHNFSLKKSIAYGIDARKKGGIGQGFSFYLCTGVAGTKSIPLRKEFQALFKASGAKYLATQRQLAALSKKAGEAEVDLSAVLIVTSDPVTSKQANDKQDAVNHGATRVAYSILLEALMKQDFTFLSPPANKKTIKTFEEAQGRLNNFGFDVSFGGVGRVIDVSGQGKTKGYSKFSTPLKKGKLPELEMALVWSTLLEDGIFRSLSNPDIGNPDRWDLGTGTGKIWRSVDNNVTGIFQFVNHEGVKKMEAEIPPLATAHKHLFGNAGKQNCIVWDAYDTSGDTSGGTVVKGGRDSKKAARLRQYVINFRSAQQLSAFLLFMFNGSVNLLEEWFDSDGRFCPKTPSLPPHLMLKGENSMDVEGDDNIMERLPPLNLEKALAKYGGVDPQGQSQLC